MSKQINGQEEYNKLLDTLRELNIEELILLFIEAKKGSLEDCNKLLLNYNQSGRYA